MEGMRMAPTSGEGTGVQQKMISIHMTFFWGKDVDVLFDGWPGGRLGLYILSLILVFLVSMLVEWLAFCKLARRVSPDSAAAGLLQALLYTLRVGLGYLVMLAVMSFNVGVLLVAVGGHALGFLLFGSSVFKRHRENGEKHQNGLPRSC